MPDELDIDVSDFAEAGSPDEAKIVDTVQELRRIEHERGQTATAQPGPNGYGSRGTTVLLSGSKKWVPSFVNPQHVQVKQIAEVD